MNLFLIVRYSWPAMLLATLLAMSGCGGGSEGTGTEPNSSRVVAGTVRALDDSPVPNALVTILETGDSTTTDAAGNFEIQAETLPDSIQLEVASGDVTSQATVSSFDEQTTAIQVAVTVDPESDQQVKPASNITVWARIVGKCDAFFDNNQVIRQSNRVNGPMTCTMKFFASGNGQKLERVPGEIQVRACGADEWRTIAQGKTGFGVNAGVGQIPFTFIDNAENCEYRLVAPAHSEQTEPLFVYVSTFSLNEEGVE